MESKSLFDLCQAENLATAEGRAAYYRFVWGPARVAPGMEADVFQQVLGFPVPPALLGEGELAAGVDLVALLEPAKARAGAGPQFSNRDLTEATLRLLDNPRILAAVGSGAFTTAELRTMARDVAHDLAEKAGPGGRPLTVAPGGAMPPARPKILPAIRNHLSYREARDRAEAAARGQFYSGLAALIVQARQTGDTDLERAAWDVVDQLDAGNAPPGDWELSVSSLVAEALATAV